MTHIIYKKTSTFKGGSIRSSYIFGLVFFYVYVEHVDGSTRIVDEDIKSTWNKHWKTMNDEFEKYLEFVEGPFERKGIPHMGWKPPIQSMDFLYKGKLSK